MVIANAVTTKNFHRTHRYLAVRSRSVEPTVIHSTMPQVSPVEADPLAAADAMAETAERSERVEKPCYHISFSAGEEDDLSVWDWNQLTRSFLEKTGLGGHQSVAYLHEDATYGDSDAIRPHVHLIVNRVDAHGRAASTNWDYYKFQNVLRELETEMGLSAEPNSWEVDRRRDPPGQVQRLEAAEAPEPTVRTQLQDAIDEAIDEATSPQGVTQFLERIDIDVHTSDQGWSVAKDDIAFAGYQLGPAYTLPAIEATLESTMSIEPDEDLIDAEDFADGGLSEEMDDQADQARESADRSYQGPLMGNLLRQSMGRSRSDEGRSKVLGTAQSLSSYGDRLVRQSGDNIDGLTVAGMGFVAAGTGLALAQRFKDAIDEARNQKRGERIQGFVDRLDEVGQRTEALEARLGQEPPELEPGDGGSPTPSGPDDSPDQEGAVIDENILDAEFETVTKDSNQPEELGDVTTDRDDRPEELREGVTDESDRTDPVIEGTIIAGGRIDQLDMAAGITPPENRLEVDPNLPIDQQLDQVDAAIEQMEDRLTLLEGRAQDIEQQQAAIDVPGEAVAETLSNYSAARAEAYMISSEEPIQTRTMGTIQVSDGGSRVLVEDNEFGTKFAATSGEAGWQVETDELSATERNRIADLPQTTDDYAVQARGKEVVRSLQQLAPTEFARPEGGRVGWKSTQESNETQTYTFEIENGPDGTQYITGKDEQGESVLDSSVSQDGVIKVSQADIPSEQIDGLARQINQRRQKPQIDSEQRTRRTRRSQQHSEELTL